MWRDTKTIFTGSSPKCQLSDLFPFYTIASTGFSGSYPKPKPSHLGLEFCHDAAYVLELWVPSVGAPELPLHPFYTGTYHFPLPIISTNLGAYVEVPALGHRQRVGDRQRGSDCNKSHEDAGFLKYFKVCHFFFCNNDTDSDSQPYTLA